MSTPTAPTRIRDADRTRRQVLDAAEEVFAREGYEAASLARIGEAAGVSRGTPSYFFGSKEELYQAVLERMYAARTEALRAGFGALQAWAQADAPEPPLRSVLAGAVDAYLQFVAGRPTYVDIIQRETLTGAERLPRLQNQSTVMEDAFGALSRRARKHGLRRFEPAEAIMDLVALGFTPLAHRHTMLRRHGIVPDDPRFLTRRRERIVDALLQLLGADG